MAGKFFNTVNFASKAFGKSFGKMVGNVNKYAKEVEQGAHDLGVDLKKSIEKETGLKKDPKEETRGDVNQQEER